MRVQARHMGGSRVYCCIRGEAGQWRMGFWDEGWENRDIGVLKDQVRNIG